MIINVNILWVSPFLMSNLTCLFFKKKYSIISPIMSQTYKPKNRKRLKTHGFLSRMKSSNGKRVLLARLRKGRKALAVSIGKKRISK